MLSGVTGHGNQKQSFLVIVYYKTLGIVLYVVITATVLYMHCEYLPTIHVVRNLYSPARIVKKKISLKIHPIKTVGLHYIYCWNKLCHVSPITLLLIQLAVLVPHISSHNWTITISLLHNHFSTATVLLKWLTFSG